MHVRWIATTSDTCRCVWKWIFVYTAACSDVQLGRIGAKKDLHKRSEWRVEQGVSDGHQEAVVAQMRKGGMNRELCR